MNVFFMVYTLTFHLRNLLVTVRGKLQERQSYCPFSTDVSIVSRIMLGTYC